MTRKRLVVLMLGFALQAVAATASGPIVTVTGGQVKGFPVHPAPHLKEFRSPRRPSESCAGKNPLLSGPGPAFATPSPRRALRPGRPGLQQGIRRQGFGGLPLPECLDPRMARKDAAAGDVLDSRRLEPQRIRCRPIFDGARLAAHGVVVVTANYRLGPFGFLAHPELTAGDPPSRIRQLHAPGPTRCAEMGQRQYREIRRRPQPCDGLRAIRRRVQYRTAAHLASRQRVDSPRD